MTQEQLLLLLPGGALVVVGAVLLAVGLGVVRRAARRQRGRVRVPGTVARGSGFLQAAEVVYPLPDGSPRTLTVWPVRGEDLGTGRRVVLLVDPADPLQAELVGTARSVRLAVLPLVGGLFVLVGLSLAAAGAALRP